MSTEIILDFFVEIAVLILPICLGEKWLVVGIKEILLPKSPYDCFRIAANTCHKIICTKYCY